MYMYIAQLLAMYLVTLGVPVQRTRLCNSLLCFVIVTIRTVSTAAQAVTFLTCQSLFISPTDALNTCLSVL
jgi:hypothetical protein